jgi:predicted DNA-binding antitoxin AbrB/MazE fold protein
MSQEIRAIYENGLFRPLDPVSIAEHDTVSLVVQPRANDDLVDQELLAWARQEGDPSTSLADVRQRLSKIKGNLSDAVISDRGAC